MNLNEIILDQRPWGRAFGLLVACAVILVGIFRSVGPAEIVLRAFTAAIVSGLFVRFFVWTLQRMSEPGPDQDPG